MAGLLEIIFPPKPVPAPPKPDMVIRGKVERVSVFVADEYYMGVTLLLEGATRACRLKVRLYDETCPAELTQPGDIVTFGVSEEGRIDADSFKNFTLETRLNTPR